MPVVTVIGASSRPFSIPITGRRANTLGRQFEQSVGDARGSNASTGNESVTGSNRDGSTTSSSLAVGGDASQSSSLAGSSSLATTNNDGSSSASIAGVGSHDGTTQSSMQITQSGVTTHAGDSTSIGDVSGGGNTIYAGSHDTVTGGINDTISAVGDLHAEDGQGNQITVNGPLTFLGGSGDTSIQSGNATVYGTNNSVYHFVGTDSGNMTLSFNNDEQQNQSGVTQFDGHRDGVSNILFDASSSHGSLVAQVGPGDTVEGGSASDTISVNNMTDQNNSGAGLSATLSGGSGAPNLFQFLNDKDGHYTITDFGSAAGNTVGVSSSQMGNLQHVLDTETVSGGNTTIQLDNQTQITFLNDTHLKHSDFHSL